MQKKEALASKNDAQDNKPDYSLIPKVLMDQIAYAMMAGAEKYERFNYTKGHKVSQLVSAAERHLKLIQEGEDMDADTSNRIRTEVSHAACVCANMLMLLHQQQLGTSIDDRFKVDGLLQRIEENEEDANKKEKEYDDEGNEITERFDDGTYTVAIVRRFMDGTNTFYESRPRKDSNGDTTKLQPYSYGRAPNCS